MKKSIIITIVISLLLFAVLPVFAATSEHTIDNITFSISDDYTIKKSEDLVPTSKVEGLIFAAISSDQKHQIQGRCTETEFSRELKSFSGLDEETIKPAGDLLFPNGYEVITIGSTLYLKSSSAENSEASVIYVTVANNKLYTFSYFGSDASRMGEFMYSVKLPKAKTTSGYTVFMIILISLFILLDVVFIIFLVTSFVKDYHRRKMERDKNIVNQYIKIKRRKF